MAKEKTEADSAQGTDMVAHVLEMSKGEQKSSMALFAQMNQMLNRTSKSSAKTKAYSTKRDIIREKQQDHKDRGKTFICDYTTVEEDGTITECPETFQVSNRMVRKYQEEDEYFLPSKCAKCRGILKGIREAKAAAKAKAGAEEVV